MPTRRHTPDRAPRGGPWPIIGITLLGALLRLSTLNTRSFWLDETTSVRQASWTLPELVARMSDNVHPPFFHFLLHYWIRFFGKSEIEVRLFPVVFGIAAIPLIYWAGRTIYDRRVGLIAAAIIAISPFFIWYSQEARMYTMMLVFAIASTAFMWRALQSNGFWWWAGYALATAAGTMTQYFFAFLVAGQAIYLFFYLVPKREERLAEEGLKHWRWSRPWGLFHDVPQVVGWLGAIAFAILPSIWWLPKVFVHKDLFRGISHPFNYGWSPPAFGIHFNELIAVPFEWALGFHSTLVMRDLVAMWPLLITLMFLSVGYARRISPKTWFLVLSGIGGATMIALLGMWQPILEARYFTATTVPIVILTARFFASLKSVVFKAVVVLMVAIALVTWVDQSYDPSSIVKWDNRQAMAIVADGFKPGDTILLIPYFVSSIPEYYLPPAAYAALNKVPSFDRFGLPRNSPAQLAQDLDRQVGPADRVWVIATWQDTPLIALDRLHTGQWLVSQGYSVKMDRQLHQIRVTLYERPAPRQFFLPAGGLR